ncbi:MAG: glycosyltransferase [Burkholderiales bacterium]|nr:glycosyltransferase [Flavobacterium sp.]
MRIVQIIDSLEVGGAERMAVNYANALSKKIDFSGLVTTRKEGDLKQHLAEQVDYLFLNKKHTVDLTAVLKLKVYCKENNVDILQPHSSSYFVAFLVKLIYPKIRIVWHDHNGLSEFLGSQKWLPLKLASCFFSGIIVVNYQLKAWAIKELKCKKVLYLPNFTNGEETTSNTTILKGNTGKRILCLANLRDQKNHFFLIKVAEKLKVSHPEWSFHLVGKDFYDDYSKQIRSLIILKGLENNVFVYGTKNDTVNIISQSDIAILTSKSEGLPVALLEYGLYKKPVVVTSVGEMPLIIKNNSNGYLVPFDDDTHFYEALTLLIANPDLRVIFGEALQKTIHENHSEIAVLKQYLEWLKNI